MDNEFRDDLSGFRISSRFGLFRQNKYQGASAKTLAGLAGVRLVGNGLGNLLSR